MNGFGFGFGVVFGFGSATELLQWGRNSVPMQHEYTMVRKGIHLESGRSGDAIHFPGGTR
eukprot:9219652-Pyramimonas_sp.AAC.1